CVIPKSQKQLEAFQQSQPQPRFKEPQSQPQPQPPTKDNCRGKRMSKRATVDLAEDDDEEEQTRQCARGTREEGFVLGTDYERFQQWYNSRFSYQKYAHG
ncbi:hypothetical protein Tco_0539194, partial [Tanacetum coccineum]